MSYLGMEMVNNRNGWIRDKYCKTDFAVTQLL